MIRLEGQRFVELSKVVDYLLNAEHADGGSKSAFFTRFGFDRDRPEALLDALASHPDRNTVVSQAISAFGSKSVVECRIDTPDGRNPCIRTVWIREGDASPHRLVTAYPLP